MTLYFYLLFIDVLDLSAGTFNHHHGLTYSILFKLLPPPFFKYLST